MLEYSKSYNPQTFETLQTLYRNNQNVGGKPGINAKKIMGAINAYLGRNPEESKVVKLIS